MVLSFSGGFLSTSSRSQVLNHEDHLQSVTDVNMSQPKTYRYVHQVSNFFCSYRSVAHEMPFSQRTTTHTEFPSQKIAFEKSAATQPIQLHPGIIPRQRRRRQQQQQ